AAHRPPRSPPRVRDTEPPTRRRSWRWSCPEGTASAAHSDPALPPGRSRYWKRQQNHAPAGFGPTGPTPRPNLAWPPPRRALRPPGRQWRGRRPKDQPPAARVPSGGAPASKSRRRLQRPRATTRAIHAAFAPARWKPLAEVKRTFVTSWS